MEKLLKWIDTCSKLGAYLSAFSMLSIVLLILVEIILRSLFHTSTMISDEYSGYLMVGLVMLGLSYTLASGSHIRITIVAGQFKGRASQILDLLVILAALALINYALYHSIRMVQDTFAYGILADSISETPLYIPQVLIPVGLALLDLQLVARFLRRLLSLPIL